MASAEVKATYLSSGIWTEKKLCTTKQQPIPYQNVLATQISFFNFQPDLMHHTVKGCFNKLEVSFNVHFLLK